MTPSDDWRLLEAYASSGSHAAFETLVDRHAGWVYATARRRVRSADLAADVTQAAFIVLARKAGSIGRRESLAAWLYRVVHYTAIDALRRQRARRRHERLAARPEVAPAADDQQRAILIEHLDTALDALSRRDREAVILRFFNNQTLEQIGRVQQVNASTVKRRLERALAHLGYQLKRNGIVTAPVALGGMLTAIGVGAAPSCATAGLTGLATAAGSLPASTAGPVGLAKGALKVMTLIKLKLAATALVAVAVVGTGSVVITHAVAQSVAGPVAQSSAAATKTPLGGAGPERDRDDPLARKSRGDWQSVELTFTTVNPANPDGRGRNASQSLALRGTLTILDTTNLLGLDRYEQLDVTRIADDRGHDMTALAMPRTQHQPWYAPLAYVKKFDQHAKQWFDELQPAHFNVLMKVDANLPRRLSVVQGYLPMLTFDRQEHVDVPYVPNGEPVTILPGMRAHFDLATHDAFNYSYTLVMDSPTNPPSFNGMLTGDQRLPERMITEKYLVDAAGRPINGNTHAFGSFTAATGTESGSGGFEGADKIAAMRFEVVTGLHERKAFVTLRDIDVPRPTINP